MRRLTILCLILVPPLMGACAEDRVTLRVMIPDVHGRETPVPGVQLFLLPYDRDSVLQELERGAPTPRPDTRQLDSLLQLFRLPFVQFVGLTARRQRLTQASDSLEARIRDLSEDAPERPDLLGALQELRDSSRALESPLETARQHLDEVRRVLPQAESLRHRMAAWEDTAHRGLDSVTRALSRASRREMIIDSTDQAGWATIPLERGEWWVVARALNVLDPNAQWTWNVRVTGDTIILNSTNGRSRPRL